MKKSEITEILIDVIELLQKAKPGSGTAVQRFAARSGANEKLSTLPQNWWRKVDDSLVMAFQDAER